MVSVGLSSVSVPIFTKAITGADSCSTAIKPSSLFSSPLLRYPYCFLFSLLSSMLASRTLSVSLPPAALTALRCQHDR